MKKIFIPLFTTLSLSAAGTSMISLVSCNNNSNEFQVFDIKNGVLNGFTKDFLECKDTNQQKDAIKKMSGNEHMLLIPKDVKTIAANAFYDVDKDESTIPSIDSEGQDFITELQFESGSICETALNHAFCRAPFKKITLPASFTELDYEEGANDYIFSQEYQLSEIDISAFTDEMPWKAGWDDEAGMYMMAVFMECSLSGTVKYNSALTNDQWATWTRFLYDDVGYPSEEGGQWNYVAV